MILNLRFNDFTFNIKLHQKLRFQQNIRFLSAILTQTNATIEILCMDGNVAIIIKFKHVEKDVYIWIKFIHKFWKRNEIWMEKYRKNKRIRKTRFHTTDAMKRRKGFGA